MGFFYVHQFAFDIHVFSKFIYEIVEVYLLNQYGCLFLSYIYSSGFIL
nr:MAG TPA: hypothetical protein [Caudoviricetes sp.]